MPFGSLKTSRSMKDLTAACGKEYPDEADKYELLESCGKGMSATVWRAMCKSFKEIVAIKLLDLESLNCRMDEVIHEAQYMSLHNHPNVLSLHTSFVSGKHLWMVMPYMPGGSVHNIMRYRHPKGVDELTIAIIMKEVVKGLEYIHKAGGIHRDVKAGNILVGLDGTVKLADFGVAATMERGGSWGNDRRGRETFVGTPCWMAPEVMEQLSQYNNKADIWSLGITFLELAHGQAPFAHYPPMKVLLMTLQNPPPQLENDQAGHRFSKHLHDLVDRCLQKDPSKRPTASQILESKFFKNTPDTRYLATHLLKGLPTLTERVKSLDMDKGNCQIEPQTKGQDYTRAVSHWNFDIPALKEQAAKEPPLPEVASPTSVNVAHQKEFDGLQSSEQSGAVDRLSRSTQSAEPEQRHAEHEGGLQAISTSRPPSEAYVPEKDDLPSSPLSGSIGSPSSSNLPHLTSKSAALPEVIGSPTSSEEHAQSDIHMGAGAIANGQRKPATSRKEKKATRFVMLDEDVEQSASGAKSPTRSITPPLQGLNPPPVSVTSSGSINEEVIHMAAALNNRSYDGPEEAEEPEKIEYQKVGRFDVGIKKEGSVKNSVKHQSSKDLGDLGKAPTYVPPATALLPRMMELMENFKYHHNAMQHMIEVVTEADRGKAFSLQKFLASPLSASKSPDHAMIEERVQELEQQLRSLEVENQQLKERNAMLEQRAATAVTANGALAPAGLRYSGKTP